MNKEDGYRLLAGKCQLICQAIAAADNSFTVVRGHYFCPVWNRDRTHWWLKSEDGVIYDPTCFQFPSRGSGAYTEFDGMCECANCGKDVAEEVAAIADNGNYAFCSQECYGRFVGVF